MNNQQPKTPYTAAAEERRCAIDNLRAAASVAMMTQSLSEYEWEMAESIHAFCVKALGVEEEF